MGRFFDSGLILRVDRICRGCSASRIQAALALVDGTARFPTRRKVENTEITEKERSFESRAANSCALLSAAGKHATVEVRVVSTPLHANRIGSNAIRSLILLIQSNIAVYCWIPRRGMKSGACLNDRPPPGTDRLSLRAGHDLCWVDEPQCDQQP